MSAAPSRQARWLWWAGVACLLALLAVMFVVPVNFSAVDLGRHLKNGALFFSTGAPISTNFYSYTEPDFPAVNHHWLSGVMFYMLWKVADFAGLHAGYLVMHLLTVLLLLLAARRHADSRVLLFIGAALLPILASRYEIRPEGVSYLALAVLVQVLLNPPRRLAVQLAIIAVVSVVWVNAHIFFFLGWVVTGAFMVQAWVDGGFRLRTFFERGTPQCRLSLVLATQLVASLANPWGVAGVLEPFFILREYGYAVVENQPIPFILKRLGGGLYWHYVGAGLVTGGLLLAAVFTRVIRGVIGPALLLVTFYALGFSAVRGMMMFALIALPMAAVIASRVIGALACSQSLLRGALALALALMAASLALPGGYFSVWDRPHRFGLMPGAQGAGKFIRTTQLAGPIFNNYDIGAYFIFHLFPQHRPFVDNRPEAYSVAFLQQTYQAMLRDEAVWKKIDGQYRFNAIFFYRHDATENAQPFLIRRIADPQWVPVFVDDYTIILARDTAQNGRINRDYALPKEMFRAVKE